MLSLTSRRAQLVLLVGSLLLVVACAILIQFPVEAIILAHTQFAVPESFEPALRPLRAPQVLDSTPARDAKDISPRTPITLTFLTAMERASTQTAFELRPKIEGTFNWIDDQTVVFRPRAPLPLSATIEVQVSAEARSWLYRRMGREFTSRFTIIGAPTVVASEPAQNARFTHVRDPFTITFDREMDRESVQAHLTITPHPSLLRYHWTQNQLLVSGVRQPATQYRVALQRGAKDKRDGLPLEREFTWSFITVEQYPFFSILNLEREVRAAANQPFNLQLQLVNVSRIDAQLYRLEPGAYLEARALNPDGWRYFMPSRAPFRAWSIDPKSTPDQYAVLKLELRALQPGFYYLFVHTPEGPFDAQLLTVS